MKRFAIALLFLCGCHAFAASILSTETLVADCKDYVKAQDNGKTTYDNNEQAGASNRCIGFVKGFMDESSGQLYFADDSHKKMVIGDWQSVTPTQEIRVFVKYVIDNPEILNRNAVETLWVSAYKAGLYTTTPVPVKPVDN